LLIHDLRLRVTGAGTKLEFTDSDGTLMETVELARPDGMFGKRIAACWNACAGIPTETLEAGVVVVPAEHLPDPEKLRRIADAIDRLSPYETDPRGPGDLRRWADNMDAVLQHSAGRTRPAGGCSVTLTDDERQIVCEALQAFAEHAEWQAGQQCPDAQEWSGAMASARALLARLQRSGGEGR